MLRLSQLPEELLAMIIAKVPPCTAINFEHHFERHSTKYLTSQLLALRMVSSQFHRLSTTHPFWWDPEVDFLSLVPAWEWLNVVGLIRNELDPKKEQLWETLCRDKSLSHVFQGRKGWNFSSFEIVHSLFDDDDPQPNTSVERLCLTDFDAGCVKSTLKYLSVIFPNVRSLGILSGDPWKHLDHTYESEVPVLGNKFWPQLEELSIVTWTSPWPKLEALNLRRFTMKFRGICSGLAGWKPEMKPHRDLRMSCVSTLTDLTLDDTDRVQWGWEEPMDSRDVAHFESFVSLQRLALPRVSRQLVELLSRTRLSIRHFEISLGNSVWDPIEAYWGILETFFREATCLRGLQTFSFGLEFLIGEEITDAQLGELVKLITTVTTVQRLALDKMRICESWFGSLYKMEELQYISWKVACWKQGPLWPGYENWETISPLLKDLEVSFRKGWPMPAPPICSFQLLGPED
jgi:F-box domain